jgi:ABC-type dipeptide/oligopeptide/nickel transport system permease subunit
MASSIHVSETPDLGPAPALRRGRLPLTGRLGLAILVVLVAGALLGPSLTQDPYAQDLSLALEGPTPAHWLGTDQLGRDLLARLVLGSRLSLAIGLGATLFGLLVGGAAGVVGGYLGGVVDGVVMRVADTLLTFPGILVALMVVAVAGTGVANVMLAVGLRAVPVFARMARASTLVVREHDFVQAARALGAPAGRILTRHIAPALLNSLVVLAALQVATAILVGSTLSFLGVGVPPETPEWGAMLNSGRRYMLQQGQLVIYPGLAIMLTILGINLFGDGLRSALDPRRTRGRLEA